MGKRFQRHLHKLPKWAWFILGALAACLVLTVCLMIYLKGEQIFSKELSWRQRYNLSFAVGGDKGFFWGQGVSGKSLTLEDVRRLSEKGMELKWTDFDGYAFWETGSGLMINVYPIDQNFSLWMGGGGGSEYPLYVYLQKNNADGEQCEIRQEDVEAFIAGQEAQESETTDR